MVIVDLNYFWSTHLVQIFTSCNKHILNCSCISGGGGVGKSTIINVVTRHCNQVLNKVGDDPNQPKILLLAPTGMAACLIGNN